MKHHKRKFALAFSALALAAASFSANAAIVFTNLGTGAPPASIGGHALTPFDQAPQAALPSGSAMSSIPGGPNGTSIGVSPATNRRAIGDGWATWSHGYTGVVYADYVTNEITLTLPAGATAFYVYVEPNPFEAYDITATSNSGTSSGPVSVIGDSGANGYAFHATAGESISSITISGTVDFAFGEFGISSGVGEPTATCAEQGYTGAKLLWCQNICEKGYTGAQLDSWIHRWTSRYRDLPYCAVEDEEPEEELPPQV